MDEILSGLVIYHYSRDFYKGGDAISSKVPDLTAVLESKDPLRFEATEHGFYEYKIKQFLSACALGLTSAAIWKGIYDANGGYIIVKKDGSIVCYHLYNWNAFQDYLFCHSYLDTPSTSRHDFGKIYYDAGKYRLKLNLQIRYKI